MHTLQSIYPEGLAVPISDELIIWGETTGSHFSVYGANDTGAVEVWQMIGNDDIGGTTIHSPRPIVNITDNPTSRFCPIIGNVCWSLGITGNFNRDFLPTIRGGEWQGIVNRIITWHAATFNRKGTEQ